MLKKDQYSAARSDEESTQEKKSLADGMALNRIKKTLGKFVLLIYDEEAVRKFNGLPASVVDKSDDPARKIIIPESAVKRGADAKEYEMVFKVHEIGPEVENPGFVVGDYVLAKGHVSKVFTEPLMYFVVKENIVAILNIQSSLAL